MPNRLRRSSLRTRMTALAALALVALPATASASVSGTVYEDFNGNGARDTASGAAVDTGVGGVSVRATSDDRVWGPVTTSASGAWTLPIPDGVTARIEVTPPGGWWPARATTAGSAPVTFFTTAPTPSIETGIQVPGRHCSDNPLIGTPCFVIGPSEGSSSDSKVQQLADDPALVAVPYDTADGAEAATAPGKQVLATWGQIGSTYGIATNPASGDYYAGAYIKRHTGLKEGTGTIFRVPRTAGGWGTPALWATVPDTGSDPHTNSSAFNPWIFDSVEAFDAVGKAGLGDVDISPLGNELYAVNLNTRSLHVVSTADAAVSAGTPVPAPAGYPAGDWRPFGLGVNPDTGMVYVGGVVSGESTVGSSGPPFGDRDGLALAVYRFDPQTRRFDPTPVLLHRDLGFGRKCARLSENTSAHDITNDPFSCVGENDARWNPWIDAEQFNDIRHSTYPQPMLTDISFQDGEMILGLRDRIGDQLGNAAYGPQRFSHGDTELYQGQPAGALYRAFPAGDGTFALEDNAANPFGGPATGGAGSAEGPGGGSWYFGDNHYWHDHVSLGSAAAIPGFKDVPATVVNPFEGRSNSYDGGFGWFSGSSSDVGRRTKSVRLFDGTNTSPDLLGKANGLGDTAPFCPLAPVQIGNRIWVDLDKDGVQDGSEPPIPGVRVELMCGSTRAETVTDKDGHWYFDSSNVVGGLPFATPCMVTVPPNQAPLDPYELTTKDAGGNDEHDSDAMPLPGNGAKINLTTGTAGQNNHGYDIGWIQPTGTPPPPPPPPPATPPEATPPPKSTPAPAKRGPQTRLGIRKDAVRDRVQAGGPVVWTVTVRNLGGVAADRVVVTDTVPPGMVFVRSQRRARAANGKLVWKKLPFRLSSGRVIWGLGTIPAKGSVKIRVFMRADSNVVGTRVNRVAVTAENAPGAKDTADVQVRPAPTIAVLPAVTG